MRRFAILACVLLRSHVTAAPQQQHDQQDGGGDADTDRHLGRRRAVATTTVAASPAVSIAVTITSLTASVTSETLGNGSDDASGRPGRWMDEDEATREPPVTRVVRRSDGAHGRE